VSRLPKEIKIKDRHGVEHRYESAPLPCKTAFRLGLELTTVLTPVFGEGAALLFGVMGEGKIDLDKAVDLSRIPAALVTVPQKLLDLDEWRLIKTIFSETRRFSPNKRDPKGNDHRLDMAKDVSFDEAYSGGNFGEMFRAMSWILSVNYSPFGTDGGDVFRMFLQRVMAFLPITKIATSPDSTTSNDAPPTLSKIGGAEH
jgi:hypothetical protein